MVGSQKLRTFNITGDNAKTLATGLKSIKFASARLTGTNDPSVLATSGGTITFTAGGAFTTDVEVIGN